MNETGLEKATFGSGCFWCTEAIFERLMGLLKLNQDILAGKLKTQNSN